MTTPEAQKPLHIIQLTAENVKRLRAVSITPGGEIVTIGGDNDQGKSTVLDAISMALGGGDQIDKEPIRRGAKKGRIVLDLGDIVVTRTFTKSGTTLVIEGRDGTPQKSPQDLLNRLTGAVTFDPFAFTQLDPKRQLEVLRNLVKVDFTTHDTKRSKHFSERTTINALIKQDQALLATLQHHEGIPDIETSVGDILREIDEATAVNNAAISADKEVEGAKTSLEKQEMDLSDARTAVASLEAQLTAAKQKVADRESAVTAAKTRLSGKEQAAREMTRIDVAPLRAKVSTYEATNAKVRSNIQHDRTTARLRENEAKAAHHTRAIEDIDEEKAATMQAVKFPVPGLSFGEDGVLLDGLPFEQAGTAEQIRVSIAMAAATNPTIRVMLIKDGSLIGSKKLEIIRQLAIEYSLQIWMEVVSDKDDKKSTVVIEDGLVVGAEPPPEEPAETKAETAKKPTEPAQLDLPPST